MGPFNFNKKFDSTNASHINGYSHGHFSMLSLLKAACLVSSNAVRIPKAWSGKTSAAFFKDLYVRDPEAPAKDTSSSMVFRSVASYVLRISGRKGGNHEVTKRTRLGIRRGCYAIVKWETLHSDDASSETFESLATILFYCVLTVQNANPPTKLCFARVRWFASDFDFLQNTHIRDGYKFTPNYVMEEELLGNRSAHLAASKVYADLGCPLFVCPESKTVAQHYKLGFKFAKGRNVLDFDSSKANAFGWVECSSLCRPAGLVSLSTEGEGDALPFTYW